MNRLLICFLLCPLALCAQPDTLKPITSDLLPATYWNGYGRNTGTRLQYAYDGIDIRRTKDLGQYIMASGDANAIREFNAYRASRTAGGWLIAGGLLSMIVGTPMMLSNRPNKEGGFFTTQPYQCPAGYYCSGSTLVRVPDNQRKASFNTGSALLLGGSLLAGIGWALNMPGKHVRRSVQYYNRALKERSVSWRLSPYSGGSHSGLGLSGRF